MAEDTRFAVAEAIEVGARIGIEWRTVDSEECRKGLAVEIEHGSHGPQADVTHDDPLLTGKIAWAHIKAYPRSSSAIVRNWLLGTAPRARPCWQYRTAGRAASHRVSLAPVRRYRPWHPPTRCRSTHSMMHARVWLCIHAPGDPPSMCAW